MKIEKLKFLEIHLHPFQFLLDVSNLQIPETARKYPAWSTNHKRHKSQHKHGKQTHANCYAKKEMLLSQRSQFSSPISLILRACEFSLKLDLSFNCLGLLNILVRIISRSI